MRPNEFSNENDFNNEMKHYQGFGRGKTIEITSKEDAQHIAQYMTKVYGWMFLGLLITAVVAYLTASSEAFIAYLKQSRMLFFGLMIGELVLVGWLIVRIHKLSVLAARFIFLTYAALNGVVFSLILMAYTEASIAGTFAITAGTFGIMTAVGYFTKTDLTSFGKLMFMGLIGIILASVVNWFLASSTLYWIITYVGVAVFVGLIAYDTQKIKAFALIEDHGMRQKGAIMGALSLYLDFVNLFLMLLRLFSRRN